MDNLKPNQLAEITQQLAAQRHALLDEMRQHVQEESEEAERLNRYAELWDPGDYSVADLMRDMRLDQLDREAEQLQAIADAEVRIQKGTYGECEDCGTEINPERLMVQPTASRCVECQEKYEREHLGHITNEI